MTAFPELIPEQGYLTDRLILKALEDGHLLEKGTWEKAQLRHASYMLRLGAKAEVARVNAAATSQIKQFTVVHLDNDVKLELQPGDTALLFSMEAMRFPECILGFTVARGLLFAQALAPENTYVDPGFTGNIYTTVTNISNRVIHLEYGMPIARLFFVRLPESVADGYRTGAAYGISQQLKSVRTSELGSPAECKSASDARLLDAIQHVPIAGIHIAEAVQRVSRRQRIAGWSLGAFAVVWPPLLLIANNSTWVKDNTGKVIAYVAAIVLAAIVKAIVDFGMTKFLQRLRVEAK